MQEATLTRLFGTHGVFYSGIIDQILPRLLKHEYTFISDESFERWRDSAEFNLARQNQIIASELVDKAHLAATTALIRTRQWMSATCTAYEEGNLLAWASAARGFVESSGDILDGLLNVGGSLANSHAALSSAISGKQASLGLMPTEIEQVLDHYVLARWMRAPKTDVRKAKENIEYVRALESGHVPRVVEFYHKVCGIVHPSSSSIDYLYVVEPSGLRLDVSRGQQEVEALRQQFPEVLPHSLIYGCNPPLVLLRVLHKFPMHPHLPELRKLDWSAIPMWATIEKSLASAGEART